MVGTRTTRRAASSSVAKAMSTRTTVGRAARTKRSATTGSVATSDSKRTKTAAPASTVVSPTVPLPSTQPLLSLDPDCVFGVFQCRPSKRNKSPYVCDVHVESLNRTAIAHLPNLDMGGKCREGVRLLLKPARDKKGNPIGPDAVNPKYGTPKCEFIAQLVLVDDNDAVVKNDDEQAPCYYSPTWVGAHPSLGESIVDQLLQRNQLLSENVVDIRRQVTLNTTSSKVTRADFVVTHSNNAIQRVVEVKTVVDTDYSSETNMDPSKLKGVFISQSSPYRRTALFPWGNSKQKGPSNEPVVSARAIKHVMELTDIVKKSKTKARGAEDSPNKATIVFLVIRSDAEVFSPNSEACPSFCRYLKQAQDAGVEILVPRVRWEVDEPGRASCFLDKMLDIEWPELDY